MLLHTVGPVPMLEWTDPFPISGLWHGKGLSIPVWNPCSQDLSCCVSAQLVAMLGAALCRGPRVMRREEGAN